MRGYRVITDEQGEKGLQTALDEKPDLILLDIMMPRLDGFAVCTELRRLAISIPVLMLTAKSRVEDRVHGLDAGADDYLVKPFSTDELLARVRALLRRVRRQGKSSQELILGSVRVDFVRQQAWLQKEPLELTTKEFAMLRLMSEFPREAVSRERFLDAVWGYGSFPVTRTVDSHIAMLRAKIESDSEHPQYIHTVHGIGYRLMIAEELPSPTL